MHFAHFYFMITHISKESNLVSKKVKFNEIELNFLVQLLLYRFLL